MYFIDTIPGNTTDYLLFDLINKKIQKKSKEEKLPEHDVYCFDLYKLAKIYQNIPFVYDIQSLLGLQLKRHDSLEEIFDSQFSERLKAEKDKINAHLKSYVDCKFALSKFTYEQLIPEEVFQKYCQEKLECLVMFFTNDNFDKDVFSFYDHNFDIIKSIINLKNPIIVDGKKQQIYYNIFGSKNSRLSIRKKSFNIFTLPKEKRDSITSSDGYIFCQMDFKSFQPRIALAIFGDDKVKQELRENDDIYKVFEGKREDNKIELISWMFSNRRNEKFDKKLWSLKDQRGHMHHDSKSGKIYNIFHRPLFFSGEEENVVFQNYICSVEADCILELIATTQNALKTSKSYLAFPFHDCLVFSISEDEISKINELKNIMETYLFQYFKVNFSVSIKVGKKFGNLTDYSLQNC